MSDPAFPTCKWCAEPSVKKSGHIWLCKKHYRFSQMRSIAKYRGKTYPSYEWLEAEWDRLKNKCPVCRRILNWFRSEGIATVVTLQHDRDGNLKLLCHSCNVRHAFCKDDTFYSVGAKFKICPMCKVKKPSSEYWYTKDSRWMNRVTYCKPCMTAKHREYTRANSTKLNSQRRNKRSLLAALEKKA